MSRLSNRCELFISDERVVIRRCSEKARPKRTEAGMAPQPSSRRELAVSVDDYVFQRVPDYRRAVIVGTKTHEPDKGLIGRVLSEACERWRAQTIPTSSLLPVQRWRKAYRRVGLNPTRTRPAVEALIRRACSGEMVSFGDACIDVGAIVTLTCVIPVGMHAIDDVRDDIRLSPASGKEVFVTFAGEHESPHEGEVIWHAGDQVLTRGWVHRQGVVGSVTKRSSLFAVNLDVIADDDLDAAITSMGDWLGAAGVSVTCIAVLDRGSPSATVNG
jgi:DNA/RNA-binding domain of Phe-tRNA-synthetase-like protein